MKKKSSIVSKSFRFPLKGQIQVNKTLIVDPKLPIYGSEGTIKYELENKDLVFPFVAKYDEEGSPIFLRSLKVNGQKISRESLEFSIFEYELGFHLKKSVYLTIPPEER